MMESFEPEGTGRSGGPGPGPSPTPPADGAPEAPPPTQSQRVLAARLSGRLRCLRCRYNLAGLSVLGVCPECGIPVRATILAAVDPYASELQPVSWPRPTAAGLVLWAAGALIAALASWALRALDLAEMTGLAPTDRSWIILLGTGALAASGVGALALVRPHRRVAPLTSLAALAAVALYAPLVWSYWWLHASFDPAFDAPYLDTDPPRLERLAVRLAIGGMAALILLALRPGFRLLAARSVLLRSGRVERQTLQAIIAAVAVAAAGDLVRAAGLWFGEEFRTVAFAGGTFLVAVGSMLITVGLAGVLVDLRRIVPVILEPAPSLDDVIEPEPTLEAPAAPPVPGGGAP